MWKYSSFIFLWKDPVHKLPCNLGKSPSGPGRQKKSSSTFGAAKVLKIFKQKLSSGRSGTVLSSHYALFHSLGLLADILRFIRWNKNFVISACFVWQSLPSDSIFFPLCRWGRGYFSRQLLGPWVSNCTGCNSLAFEILQYTTQKCKVCVQSLGHYNILSHKRLPTMLISQGLSSYFTLTKTTCNSATFVCEQPLRWEIF